MHTVLRNANAEHGADSQADMQADFPAEPNPDCALLTVSGSVLFATTTYGSETFKAGNLPNLALTAMKKITMYSTSGRRIQSSYRPCARRNTRSARYCCAIPVPKTRYSPPTVGWTMTSPAMTCRRPFPPCSALRSSSRYPLMPPHGRTSLT